MKLRLTSICTLFVAGILLASAGAFAEDANSPSGNTQSNTGMDNSAGQSANQPGTAASNEPGTAGNMNQGASSGQSDQNVQPGQAPGTAASPSSGGY